jgi:hypothetical protein
MKPGIPEYSDAQAVVLARMAATRAELIAASQLSKIPAGARATAEHASRTGDPVFLSSPIAALLAVMLVGSVVIGPRRILSAFFRAGLTAWVTKTVHALVAG